MVVDQKYKIILGFTSNMISSGHESTCARPLSVRAPFFSSFCLLFFSDLGIKKTRFFCCIPVLFSLQKNKREHFLYLCKEGLVDAVVSTSGGVEEDFVKCVGETYLGDFSLPGKDLRAAGINRIGNLLVPNNNHANFEDFMTPVLDACVAEGGYETPSIVSFSAWAVRCRTMCENSRNDKSSGD